MSDDDGTLRAGEDLQLLATLPAVALREGYVDAWATHGVLHMRREHLRRDLRALPAALQNFVRLFGLGETVDPESLIVTLGRELLDALTRIGIVLDTGAGVHCGGLALLPVLGHLALVPAPSGNGMVYFGDDTAALLARLRPRPGGRALNPHAGPGVIALAASRDAAEVVAVEDDPLARACAELNLVINDVADRVTLASAEEALRDRYDYVVANPPLSPFPPSVIKSGRETDSAPADKLLGLIPSLLTDGGTGLMVGAAAGSQPSGPGILSPLHDLAGEAGLLVMVNVISSNPLAPGSPTLDALVWAAARNLGLPTEVVEPRMQAWLEQYRYDRLYLFAATMSDAGHKPRLTVARHDLLNDQGFWFR